MHWMFYKCKKAKVYNSFIWKPPEYLNRLQAKLHQDAVINSY